MIANGEVSFSAYINLRYNFLGNRLAEFDEQLSIMKDQIIERVHSETQTSEQLA